MDVLVQWKDGIKNTVRSNELEIIGKHKMRVGSKVKMYYIKKWYTGTVIDMETEEILDSTDSEELPLASLASLIKRGRAETRKTESSDDLPLVKKSKVDLNSPEDFLKNGKLHKQYN